MSCFIYHLYNFLLIERLWTYWVPFFSPPLPHCTGSSSISNSQQKYAENRQLNSVSRGLRELTTIRPYFNNRKGFPVFQAIRKHFNTNNSISRSLALSLAFSYFPISPDIPEGPPEKAHIDSDVLYSQYRLQISFFLLLYVFRSTNWQFISF